MRHENLRWGYLSNLVTGVTTGREGVPFRNSAEIMPHPLRLLAHAFCEVGKKAPGELAAAIEGF